MIRYFRIYTGGNTSRPVHHHAPRKSRKVGSIANSIDGTHRIAYFREPFRPVGGAA